MPRWLRVGSVLAVAMLTGLACASVGMVPAAVSTRDGVRFVLVEPGARSVVVAGSFNQWSTTSHPLSRDPSSGAWTALVPLPRGEHLFMYVVDGERWISPPAAEDYVDDGFGARNGIVIVRQVGQ